MTPFARPDDTVAPTVVSRLLAAAVLEQFARERAVETDSPSPVEQEVSTMPETTIAANAEPQAGPSGTEDPAFASIPLWKRLFDCAAILLTSPVWVPVMLVIMIGIKCSSAGPIFYRQARIGYRGRRFMIFKFRTMKVNVETRVHESYFERLIESDAPMTKLDANGDPRLISCGRFLRAAGLDELPQLFNVLRGDMSLVGPRPCTVHEFERYLPWQRERVNAPPGLTGYWQVNGKNKTTFSEMIDMDILYSKKMSLSFDLWILWRTIPAVLGEIAESRAASAWKSSSSALRGTPQTSNH